MYTVPLIVLKRRCEVFHFATHLIPKWRAGQLPLLRRQTAGVFPIGPVPLGISVLKSRRFAAQLVDNVVPARLQREDAKQTRLRKDARIIIAVAIRRALERLRGHAV